MLRGRFLLVVEYQILDSKGLWHLFLPDNVIKVDAMTNIANPNSITVNSLYRISAVQWVRQVFKIFSASPTERYQLGPTKTLAIAVAVFINNDVFNGFTAVKHIKFITLHADHDTVQRSVNVTISVLIYLSSNYSFCKGDISRPTCKPSLFCCKIYFQKTPNSICPQKYW